jgi:uncharacterized repeat protein (TIGR01451 family)
MKMPPRWFTATLAVCAITAEMFIPVSRVNAQLRPAQEQTIAAFDSRAAVAEKSGEAALRMQAEARLKSDLPSVTVSYDPLLGTPKFIRAQDGFLTGPNGQGRAVSAATAQALPANDPYLPVKAFLNEHAALFNHGAEVLAGAKLSRESVGAHNGLRTVVWQQQLDGIPVFEGVLIGNISKHGELVSLSSQFLPNPTQNADAGTPNRQALQGNPAVSVQQAIINAAQSLGDSLAAGNIVTNPAPNDSGYQAYHAPMGPVHARLVWLPMSRNTMRLSWEVFLFSQTIREKFQVLVAADTGEVLLRRNITKHISNATYNVYTSDSPSPFSPGWPTPNNAQPPLTSRTIVTIAALSTNASPNGWIDDGNNSVIGNNAETYLDRNDDYVPDRPQPQGTNRVFNFPLDLTQDPTNYADASQVQLFYWLNWYHDRLYDLGFTEAAGNYQDNNFGRGGLGNDHVLGHVQDGADIGQANNSYWIPAPDGINGDEHMFIFTGPNPNRDGSLDAEVILHETTHGTSERLVGAGTFITALQTAGMGEGWSDFYADSLLSQPGDNPNGVYAMGGYVTYQFVGITLANYYFGIRHFPYCTDMTKNPFTFKDIDPGQISSHPGVPRSPVYPFFPQEADEVHHQGEVWCVTLWEVRANLVNKYGYAGNQTMLQIVTDGMKLGPANPNFLQARDAIILADRVDNGGANFLAIWQGFAKRGMGVSASSPDSSTTAGVHETFDLPGVQIIGTILPGGNGNGVIDPNECNTLFLVLTNLGLGATNIQATLATTNANVIVTGRLSSYPNLPPGSGATNLTAFQFSTSPSFVCGTLVSFTLTFKCDQFVQTNFFSVQSGVPGTPVRFNNTTPVPIPDNSPVGADSPIVASGLSEPLRKVTVSLYLTHTYDADLLLQLVSPEGITNTLAANVGGSGDNFGSSCADGSRTVFDDSALTLIGAASPPFIGSFKPAQPFSAFIGKAGTNINGTWHLHVVDQAAFDIGTIQCWTLLLTPSVCTDGGGECPGSDLAIAGSAAPEPVIINNELVYSLSITNRGPKAAKGVTLTQPLPASVVFVSAHISQGSISYSGGVISGNIGTMAAGAVVTATVTVRPTQAGTLTSTASAAALSDPDPDLSNNSVTITSHINPLTSDMAVSMAGSPNPVLVGGTLTYTISVTNNGPSDATGVVASNALPASVALTSATPSQGTTTIVGNAVLFNFGSISVGGAATATITVIPSAQGLITATATVTANQFDSQSANNTATVTTSVSPSADLAVGFVGVPATIVLGNNLTYTINATNLGPNTATSVLISQILPPGATVVSSNSTPGTTLSQSGNTINCNVGILPSGSNVTMTVVVSISSNGIASSTATITGALADPNAANNSATANTLVATPFVNIQAAGATLTAESFVPANGAIEPGETVTVQLRLANAGNVPTTNLMAKLLATGGVTSPSAATQTYVTLLPGSFPGSKPFSFTASGTNGGVITATLQLTNNGLFLTNVSFVFSLQKIATFANTNVIVIPDVGSASPYPSTITVSGVTGLVGKVTATLSNFNHTYPHDVSVLLVAPSGASTLLMSHAADLSSAAGADLTFDDSAASPLPASGSVASGSWQPSAYAPAPVFFTNAPPATNPPAGPYGSPAMSLFNGSNPNGTWLLFVMDDSSGDRGGISNGWSLAVTTITPVNQVADLSLAGVGSPNPVQVGSNLTNTFTVTNNGTNSASAVAFTNVLPANVSLISASASQGSVNTNGGKVVVILGSLSVGASATVVEVMTPNASGRLTNSASVSAVEIDLVPANNTNAIITTVNLPAADVAVAVSAAPNPVVTGSNLVYTISVTNNGTNTALNTIVTDPLPATVAFVSSSLGTFSSGTLTCNLGSLVVGTAVSITVTTHPVSIGTITNTVSVATGSTDTNTANNSASVVTVVRAPAANIFAASAKLVSESFTPPDGVVDPGETVSVSLALSDIGEIDATTLVATLLNTGGVTGSSGAQNYGALVNNGPAVSRTFSFTASSAASGMVTATLQLQDGASSLGTVAFTFTLPQTNSFANSSAIIIPDHGSAAPYPSTINVSGLAGVVSRITVILNGVTHSFPHDIGVLLVSPSGAKSVVMSGVGGGNSISNLNLTFDDAAAAVLSDSAQIISGTYKPTDNPPGKTFPTPAPAGVATNLFAKFDGTAPNGVWSLYVVDNAVGDSGFITGGWSLVLTTVSPINSAADLYISAAGGPSPVYVGANVTYTFVVTNKGPSVATAVVVSNTLPASAALGTVTHSQGTHSTGGNLVVFNLGSIGVSASATMSIVVNPGVGGFALDAASVSANEADLYLADNSASASVSVLSIIAPHLSGAIVETNQFQITLTGQPNFTYVIQASTNITSWSSISTNTAAGNGVLQFTDTNAPGLNQRFYRAVVVAP